MCILRNAVLFIIFTSFVVFAESQPSTETSEPEVVLRQEWFPYSGFSGEVAAAKRFASSYGFKLKIQPGAEDVDPIKLVLAKQADFGVVGADLLITAIAKGYPLVAVGMVNDRSPTCFLVKEDSGIDGPKDFIGKRVGILAGTNTERIYSVMMQRAHVNRKKIREVTVPFELQTFLLGRYDVRPAFVYDEPVTLDSKAFKYKIINPETYGVNFVGTVYFTRKEMVNEHPDTVLHLVQALIRGWKFALAHPNEAIHDLVQEYPGLDADREERSLIAGREYFVDASDKPLSGTRGRWENTIKGLEEIGEIKQGSVAVDQVWDGSFVEKAYEE